MEPHNGAYTLLTVRFYLQTQSILQLLEIFPSRVNSNTYLSGCSFVLWNDKNT